MNKPEQEKTQESEQEFYKKNAAEIVKQTGDNLQSRMNAEHLRNDTAREFFRND